MSTLTDGNQTYVVTLVHGTFSCNASWCKENSHFRQALATEIKDIVHFEVFRWSGRNFHTDRVLGGTALSIRIKELAREYPKSQQFIVAHSHGGNVVRYALRDVEAANCISGVATLATPFIKITERLNQDWLLTLVSAFVIQALLMSVCIVGALVASVVYYAKLNGMDGAVRIAAQYSTSLLTPLLGFTLYAFRELYLDWVTIAFVKLQTKFSARRTKVFDLWYPPKIHGISVLCSLAILDEANEGLRVTRTLGDTAINFISTKHHATFIVLLLPMVLMFGAKYLLNLQFDLWWLIAYCVGILFLELLFMPLVIVIMLCLALVPLPAMGAYGGGRWLDNWLLDIDHERTPSDWTPVEVRRYSVKKRWWLIGSLAHCLIYETPSVIADIASWMKKASAFKREAEKSKLEPRIEAHVEHHIDREFIQAITKLAATLVKMSSEKTSPLLSLAALEQYRPLFFNKLKSIFSNRPGIRIVGDRFVFQSETFFDIDDTNLRFASRADLDKLTGAILELQNVMPAEIDWIISINAYGDARPMTSTQFDSKWEFSLAQSVSLVAYLISKGVLPIRLHAAGFGEFNPLDSDKTEEADRRNRRIELKLSARATVPK